MSVPSASSKTYTAAVVGCGKAGDHPSQKGGGHKIGYTHARMFKSLPGVRLVAAADINPENLTAWQKEFGVEKGFLDYQKMLREIHPDLLSIATYQNLHRPIIEAAIDAGVKGILCEKPFLPTWKDCLYIRDLADKTGVKIVVAYIRRHRPIFQKARKLWLEGAVGKPMICTHAIEGWDLSEMGSHTFDMFRFFHDEAPIKWVFGQARVRDLRGYGHAMEDHAVAYMEFTGGGRALIDGGVKMNDGGAMTLLGSDGVIRIAHEKTLTLETPAGRTVEEFADPWDPLWTEQLRQLILWIEGGAEPGVGYHNALKTSEANLAAYLSALRGDRVDLPLNDDTAEWPVEILARRKDSVSGGR